AVHYGSAFDEAKGTLAALEGDGHLIVQADLADADATREMVDAAADGLDGLDVAVNNAGTYVAHPIATVSYDDSRRAWRRPVAVTRRGARTVAYRAARRMTAAGHGGRIVNVSSRGAFRGEPDPPAYGASKAGMNAMGQSLAKALAPHGISVATVAP